MKYNKDAVNNLINAIFPLPDQFGLDTGSDIPIGMSEIQARLLHYDKKANIFYGMSKMVITSPALENVVIKIPFNGYLEYGYDEKEDDFDDYWIYFAYADDGDDGSNYCWAEYKRYKEAREEKVNTFLAETVFHDVIDGISIFVQEKVNPACYSKKKYHISHFAEYLTSCLKVEYEMRMALPWVSACVDYYGISKTTKFLKYCHDVAPEIMEDLHNGNYGFRPDGSPCLLDFSSFDD